MTEDGGGGLPGAIANRVAHLRSSHGEHLRLLQEILAADRGNLFGIDFVVVAVIQRSLSLIDGFTAMVERRNPLCAAPLLRLQLDSVMRLYACSLVDDPHLIALRLLEGQPLRKVKSKDGHSLTDKYLHEEVSKLYPWASRVYNATSAFVHLSMPHMLSPVTSFDDQSRTMKMKIGGMPGREWKETEMMESIEVFMEATTSLLHLCYSWLATKRKVAEDREAEKA
jgi:hypothetical protein